LFNETHCYQHNKEGDKMNTSRTTAILVGVLYIIGTVTGVLSVVFTQSVLDAPDYLARISANGSQIVTGALLVLTMGLALALVPVVIFPVLKKHHEVLALGYVVFRGGLETVTYIAAVISFLLLVPLSQAAAQSGVSGASNFQALGALLLKAREISTTTTEIVFPLGALMFYFVLYQSRLIPRWISGWGLIAVFPYLASGLLHMFGVIGPMSAIQNVLVLPMAVQEMVMAVWLIVKGFNSSAIASGSGKTDVNQF
jgi:hypothetical protein